MSDSTTPVKVCSRCGVEKSASEFNLRRGGQLRPWCRECMRQYNIEWRERNPHYHAKYNAQWRVKHRDQHRQYMREYQREWMRLWRADNPEAARAHHRQSNAVRGLDPHYRLAQRISAAMYAALRGGKAGRHWESMVGYTLADLAAHLEAWFTEGMSWENMGEWHVDHIIPRSLFNQLDECEFRACWSLGNLRPMWGRTNASKGDTIYCIGKRVRDLSGDERAAIVAAVIPILAVA